MVALNNYVCLTTEEGGGGLQVAVYQDSTDCRAGQRVNFSSTTSLKSHHARMSDLFPFDPPSVAW